MSRTSPGVNGLQHLQPLGDHLGADAVTADDGEVVRGLLGRRLLACVACSPASQWLVAPRHRSPGRVVGRVTVGARANTCLVHDDLPIRASAPIPVTRKRIAERTQRFWRTPGSGSTSPTTWPSRPGPRRMAGTTPRSCRTVRSRIDPATAVLHYAQEIFEGLKAYQHADGSVWTFRADQNAQRFAPLGQAAGPARAGPRGLPRQHRGTDRRRRGVGALERGAESRTSGRSCSPPRRSWVSGPPIG